MLNLTPNRLIYFASTSYRTSSGGIKQGAAYLAAAAANRSTPAASQPAAQNAAALTFGSKLANEIKTNPAYSTPFSISKGQSNPANFNVPIDSGSHLSFQAPQPAVPTIQNAPSKITSTAFVSPKATAPASTGGLNFSLYNTATPAKTTVTAPVTNFGPAKSTTIQQYNAAKALNPTLSLATFVKSLKATGATETDTEEEKKKKAEAIAAAAGVAAPAARISFTKWKLTNPTGTFAQWKSLNDAAKAGTAAPLAPAAPEAPGEEITVPEDALLPPDMDVTADVPTDTTTTETTTPELSILNNPDLQAQLEAIQQEYLGSFTPTTEEQLAQEAYDKEQAALEQGLVNVQDQPIALPFITGQQAAIERRASARMTPLNQALARLQNLRTTKGQMASARLGFTNEALNREATKEATKATTAQQEFENQLALATKGLRYDPNTKTFSIDPTLSAATMTPSEKANLEAGLRDKYLTQSGTFQTVRDYYNRILVAAKEPSAAGDIAIIFSYMKVLDPTSVVREGEFATAANAASVPDSLRNLWNRAVSGERIAVNRQDFVNQASNIFNAAQKQNTALANEFTRIANNNGVNPENVIVDLSSAIDQNIGTVDNSGGKEIATSTNIKSDLIKELDADLLSGYSLTELQKAYPELTSAQITQRKQELAQQAQDILKAYMASLGL